MTSPASTGRAIVVLTPPQSKRIIAKAVARLSEVQQALKGGRLIIANGVTTAYVAEELTGKPVSKWHYAAGVVANGRLDVTEAASRLEPIALRNGKPFEGGWLKLLEEFGRGDVFVKGANAVDADGNVGVLLASPAGGTVGHMFGVVAARGAHLIAPVSLERLVPDVIEAARHCGIAATDLVDGVPSGMAVLTNARLITELEAFETLFDLQAWHLASGGVAGSEGAVVLALEGDASAVKEAFDFTEALSQEPSVVRE